MNTSSGLLLAVFFGMDPDDAFELTGDVLEGIQVAVALGVMWFVLVMPRIHAHRVRRLSRPGNASEPGAPTYERIRADPDGWRPKLASQVMSIHCCHSAAAGGPAAYRTFAHLQNGNTVELDWTAHADIAVTGAIWLAELIGVPLKDESGGTLIEGGFDPNNIRSPELRALESRHKRRRRIQASVLGLICAGFAWAAWQVYAAEQHDYQDAVAEYESELGPAREKAERFRESHRAEREAIAAANAGRSGAAHWEDRTTPMFSEKSAEIVADAMLPSPPREPEFPDWSKNFLFLALLFAIAAASRLTRMPWRYDPALEYVIE